MAPDLSRPANHPAIGSVRRSFAPWDDPQAVPLIRFEGVTKRFGGVVAVDAVTFDIHAREFFALLGPSGCGKTTLMRMLAGFETPSEGRITLAGEDLAGIPPYRRPVNMMFQSYALFPHMTVEQNIAFGLEQEGMARAKIRTRVDEMLALVKLTALARRKPQQLSGGQRQRVALARALAKQPKVLLLDEPLAALDKKLREETQFELMDIQMELGTTFMVVTHDQEEAMIMADRIAIMNHGTIEQIAPPAIMYEQPASRYVADFLGDVTLFEGRVTEVAPDMIAMETAQGLRLSAISPAQPVIPGQTAWLAVRPEKISIARSEDDVSAPIPARSNRLDGHVYDIAYLGDWTVYLVNLADGRRLKVSRANAERFVERPLTWEEPVTVHFAPESAVVLTR